MLTLTTMLAHARSLMQDQDSAIPDASLTVLLNEMGNWYQAQYMDHARELTPTAAGLATLSAGTVAADTTPTNINRILSATLVDGAGVTSAGSSATHAPLDRLDVNELYMLRRKSSANGTIRYWAAYRQDGRQAGLEGKWRVLLHPPPSGTAHVALYVDAEWLDLASGTDVADCTPDDAYIVARLAALQGAHILDRSGAKIQQIADLIPLHIREAMGVHERAMKARVV